MKNHLTVTIENNEFVISETVTIIQTNQISKTNDFKELAKVIENAGYKTAQFSDEAKIFKQSLIKLSKVKNDVKRQERQARMRQRVADTKARVEARIAALNEKLEKLEKSSETTEVSA
jgi:predicted  nucleic acid-binding Zn-ribbon protein